MGIIFGFGFRRTKNQTMFSIKSFVSRPTTLCKRSVCTTIIPANFMSRISKRSRRRLPKIINTSTDITSNNEHDLHLHSFLNRPALMVTRQLEWTNLIFGFEEANRYVITDPETQATVGYIMEEKATGIIPAIVRNILHNHRPFSCSILDANGNVMLKATRPFKFINSQITVSNSTGDTIGDVHQRWNLFRRCYDLFIEYGRN